MDIAEYYKFSFVRNPWDRMVSNWKMFTTQPFRMKQLRAVTSRDLRNFKDFVNFARHVKNHHWQPQKMFLPNKLDFLGRIEEFESDFRKLQKLVGAEFGSVEEKNSNKTIRLPYGEYYTPELVSLVTEMYADDIAAFGYTFGNGELKSSGTPERSARFSGESSLERAKKLVDEIVVLESNSYYRMADVYYGKGLRHAESANKVIELDECKDTILREYLEKNSGHEVPNIALLSDIVDTYAENNPDIAPREGEIVVHMRAGDVVQFDWFLEVDYAGYIERSGMTKCAIVIAFSFGDNREKDMWMFTEDKLVRNREKFTELMKYLLDQLPGVDFRIVSNSNVDTDFATLVLAEELVRDRGGFSDLIAELRRHRGKAEPSVNSLMSHNLEKRAEAVAAVHEEAGDWSAAIAEREKVIALGCGNQGNRRRLAKDYQAVAAAHEEAEDWSAAIAAREKVMALIPDHPGNQKRLARDYQAVAAAHEEAEDWSAAIAAREQAMALIPDHPGNQKRLARDYQAVAAAH
ncbi:MAG: sulfotransferase family protein, partial [Gammaproteobacteria bacterium]|nr:sulfotransferase family protein [Gammaproteobacteria bacterium]